ncbi:hypothetical protein C8J57DRAFT_1284984 [Mycena rebaudengoi]|nr:hypothetical protein C8J57DRAFT_1284984 [Mycena rebaudengoi]
MNFPRQTSSSDSPVSPPATSQALSAALAANARADSVSGASSGSGSVPGQSDSGPSRSAPNSQSQSASEKSQSSQSQLSQSLQSQSQSRSSASNSDSASSGSLSVSGSTSSVNRSSGSVSFTTIVTSIDNQLTTTTSALPNSPTSLSTDSLAKTAARRTAIIVGATAAVVGVVLLLLGILFFYKRHKGRKLEFSEGSHGAGGVGLLDEEGFDDDDNVPMRRYRDHSTSQSISHSANMSSHSLGPPQSPAPSLFRQRASTGSAFREEGVWPPPQGERFVDPLVGVGTGEGLGHIIDDIMGPAPAATAASSSSLYTDPFRDLSHTRNPSDPSLYYERPGASSSMSMASSSGSRPTTPQSLLGLPAGAAPAPKKPSPLASSAPPSASGDMAQSVAQEASCRASPASQSSNEGH